MKQKNNSFWLAALLMLVGQSLWAYDAKIDGIYYNFSGTNAIVTYQNYSNYTYSSDYSGNIKIPGEVTYKGNTYKVNSIGNSAFYNCKGLTNITIPEGVSNIGYSAFYGCSGMTSIKISSSVTSIGSGAFIGCTGLTYAEFTSIESLLKINFLDYSANPLSLAHHLYVNGKEMKDLVVPSTVTSINTYAFQGCTGLTSIEIPSSVMSIGSNAFSGCTGLTNIVIPSSVTSIGGYAFYGCSGLTSIEIPSSVTSIGGYAFYGCSGLTSIEIPSSVTSIGEYAFYGCEGLSNIVIPSSVTSIGSSAFSGCTGTAFIDCNIPDATTSEYDGTIDYSSCAFNGANFNTVVFGNNIYKIGSYAFYNNWNLKKVFIGNNVSEIGTNAFNGCTGLYVVYSQSSHIHPESGSKDDGYVAYNAQYVNAYSDYKVDGDFIVSSYSNYYIYGYFGSNKSITLPSVSYIDDYAFYGCDSLENVSIPAGVASIGENAFYGCNGLTCVSVPSSVTSIGYYAFSGCDNMSSVKIESDASFSNASLYLKVGDISYQVLDKSNVAINRVPTTYSGEMTILPSITAGNTFDVTSVGDNAFYNCKELTNVVFPDCITSIGRWSFSGCTKLKKINIPCFVSRIGNGAFAGCSSLESMSFAGYSSPSSTSEFPFCSIFGTSSFSGSTAVQYQRQYSSGTTTYYVPLSLKNITITGEGSTVVPDKAFWGCSSLTNVVIGDSVINIGRAVFSGCSSLETMTLPWIKYRKEYSSIYAYPFGYIFGGTDYTGSMQVKQNYRYYSSSYWSTNSYNTFSLPTSLKSVTITRCDSLMPYVFQNCAGLTNIILPDSVRYIGYSAFSGCTGLKSFTLPDSLKNIDSYAFSNCTGLNGVILPDSLTTIGEYAFSGCTSLTDITIPDSVRILNNYVFSGCSGLKSTSLPDSLTSIGLHAFENCTALTSLTIPDGVKTIGYYAFNGCTEVTSLTTESNASFSNANLYLTNNGIRYQVSSKNKVSVAPGLESYSGGIVIPSEIKAGNTFVVKSIGNNAFNNCIGLTSVTIGDSITSIQSGTFYGCSALKSITLPFIGNSKYTPTSTNQYPFGYIFGTNSYSGGVATEQSYYGSSASNVLKATYYIPQSLKTVTITSSEYIPSYAFSNCIELSSVSIPASVTNVGNSAFEGCTGLTSVNIESDASFANASLYLMKDDFRYQVLDKKHVSIASKTEPYSGKITIPTEVHIGNTFVVNRIDNSAFKKCIEITDITIGDSITDIGSSAFYGCTGLKNIENPTSVTSIGSSAFSGCINLKEFEVGDNVRSIGSCAFSGCSGLEKISVAVGNTVFDSRDNCNAIVRTKTNALIVGCKSTSIPESVKSIGSRAFDGCKGLKNFTVPESVDSIGNMAFYGCTSLESITLPFVGDKPHASSDTYQYPFGYIFGGSGTSVAQSYYGSSTSWTTSSTYVVPSSLKSVTITGGGYIPYGAFYNCSRLADITIGDGVTSISTCALYGCSLRTIIVGNGVTSIGSNQSYPKKTIWMGNSRPSGYSYLSGSINYASSSNFSNLSNVRIYPYLSSMFEVNGVKYVPVNLSERTCDAIDCSYLASDSVMHIGKTVSFKNIDMKVNTINPYMAYSANNLKSISIEEADADIENYAFYDCSNANKIHVANNGNIGNYAFCNCTGLKTLDIPDNVTGIGINAFYGCSKLNSVSIGNGVKNIDHGAFADCPLLGHIVVADDNDTYDSRENSNAIIETAKNKLVTGCYTTIIPEDVECIGDSAFYRCENLANITIPEKVANIGNYAFYNCSDLSEITIPDGVVKIGNYAFRGMDKVTNVSIPQSVTNIGNYAFSGWNNLKTVVIENEATGEEETPEEIAQTFDDWTSTNTDHGSISSKTYTMNAKSGYVLSFDYTVSSESGYDNLVITLNGTTIITASGEKTDSYSQTFTADQTVTLVVKYTKDDGVSNGKDQAKVYNIVLGSSALVSNTSVLCLGSNGSSPMFSDCPLDSVYIGRKLSYNTTSSGGYSPFYRNTNLRSVHITDKETEIYVNEFYGCSNLKYVFMGDGVKTIGNYAFSGCSSLETFIFGSSMESIGKEAFSDCSAMTRLYSEAAVPPVCGSQALEDINKWECTLYVPNENIEQYRAADQWKDFFFMESNPFAGLKTYRITYMVEGLEYRVDSVEESSPIPTFAAPTREGYSFSWSEIPSVMPNHDLIIVGTFSPINLQIVDGEMLAFLHPFTYESVTYTRTFGNTSWQALYVPFSIPIETLAENGLQVAELNDTHQWDFDSDGIADSTRVEFFTITSGSTLANHPYMVRARAVGTYSLTLEDVDVEATTECSIDCSTTRQLFTFTGTYTGVTGAEMYSNRYYAMAGGAFRYAADATVSLKPQRWYMGIENRDGSEVTAYAAAIRFCVDGIEELDSALDINGTMAIGHRAEDCYYGTDGIRRTLAPTQPGIYVHQGKKLLIR